MYPVIAISERACLLLHEGRIIGLRILPRNCGEVEARHVPGYRHFGERTLFRIEAQPEGPRAFIVSSILDQKRERGCRDINMHIIWLLYEATPQALFGHNGAPKGRPP
jgi:hypothetical protein